jgi:hypothetical protein
MPPNVCEIRRCPTEPLSDGGVRSIAVILIKAPPAPTPKGRLE